MFCKSSDQFMEKKIFLSITIYSATVDSIVACHTGSKSLTDI